VRKADAVRSRNAAGAIHRVDFRPRLLVARISTGIWCRVTDVATNQLIVDTGAKARERRLRSRPRRPRLYTDIYGDAKLVRLKPDTTSGSGPAKAGHYVGFTVRLKADTTYGSRSA
jgi:hypothetical protein